MKNFFRINSLTIADIAIGSVGGLLYWKYVGCTNGTCYLQSNPFRMTLYGAYMGGILFNIFQPKTNQ